MVIIHGTGNTHLARGIEVKTRWQKTNGEARKQMANFFKNLFKTHNPPKDLGRNDLCWCGSGKKYKKCHLDSDDQIRAKQMPLSCSKSK